MKINRLDNNNIMNLYNKNRFRRSNVETNKTAKKDSIEISEQAKMVSNLSKENIKIPDKATLERIKTQINNGTYKVDSKKLAQSIMKNITGKDI